jgi:hypothetical protein
MMEVPTVIAAALAFAGGEATKAAIGEGVKGAGRGGGRKVSSG